MTRFIRISEATMVILQPGMSCSLKYPQCFQAAKATVAHSKVKGSIWPQRYSFHLSILRRLWLAKVPRISRCLVVQIGKSCRFLVPNFKIVLFIWSWRASKDSTFWQSNIAIESGPSEGDLPITDGDFPLLWSFTKGQGQRRCGNKISRTTWCFRIRCASLNR